MTVSIISIAAEDCSLENLSVVTEKTRGEVERVDPRTIAENFQSILTNPIIATGCMATIFLHKGLMFRGEIDDEFEVLQLIDIHLSTPYNSKFRPTRTC